MSGANEIVRARPGPGSSKGSAAFRTIGEVAEDLDLPAHVLRFWESKFPQLQPLKRRGGRRYYRPEDVVLLRRIRQCLYQEGYTIRGVRQLLDGDADGATNRAPPVAIPLPLFQSEDVSGMNSDAPPDRDPDPPAAPVRTPRRPRRRPASPESKATLEEIRRDLLDARALLDELLRRRRAP